MTKIHSELLNSYDNMKLKTYRDDFDGMKLVDYDDLPDMEIDGVLKANYHVDGRLKQVYSKTNNHCIVVAGTGLGKTTQVVLPTIFSFARQKVKKSMVISDPKGEVRRITEGMLRKAGYKILRLDFRDPMHSECWNPLTPIFREYTRAYNLEKEVTLVDTENGKRNMFRGKIYEDQKALDADIGRIRRVILENVGNMIDNITVTVAPFTGGKDNMMWEQGGRDVIRAFLWAMLEDSRPATQNSKNRITEDTYSFSTIIHIANSFVGNTGNSSPSDYDNGYFSARNRGNRRSRAYYYAANTVVGPAPNTRASYMSVFNTQIGAFKETATKLITSCNSFDFADLMDGPVAIFINYKDEVQTSYSLISLFIQRMYIYLIEQANKTPEGKLKTPWYFLLDEFGNFPALTDFNNVISACRGRNIFFELIVQSYAQLEAVYGHNTSEVIKDNLNVHLFLGSNNTETLNAFSRECGNMTRISPLSALNGNKEVINNYQFETIPLIPVSRLAKLDEGEGIATEANTGYVMWSMLERWYKCKEFTDAVIPCDEGYESGVDPFDAKYVYDYVPMYKY